MATAIEYSGHLFAFHPGRREWRATSSTSDAAMLAELLTSSLDPAGPSGAEPNIGDWAIRQTRREFPEISVLSRTETPPTIPGVTY